MLPFEILSPFPVGSVGGVVIWLTRSFRIAHHPGIGFVFFV